MIFLKGLMSIDHLRKTKIHILESCFYLIFCNNSSIPNTCGFKKKIKSSHIYFTKLLHSINKVFINFYICFVIVLYNISLISFIHLIQFYL